MSASIRLSELSAVSSLADSDLFLITDASESRSKKLTVADLTSHLYSPLYTVFGTTVGSSNMGTFSGSVLSDNFTVKQLFQQLANALVTEASNRATAVAAVQADVDQNESDADAAIAAVLADVANYKQYIEARNLEAGLALGDLYVEELIGG